MRIFSELSSTANRFERSMVFQASGLAGGIWLVRQLDALFRFKSISAWIPGPQESWEKKYPAYIPACARRDPKKFYKTLHFLLIFRSPLADIHSEPDRWRASPRKSWFPICELWSAGSMLDMRDQGAERILHRSSTEVLLRGANTGWFCSWAFFRHAEIVFLSNQFENQPEHDLWKATKTQC